MGFMTVLVLSLISGSFIAIAAQSIFDSIADQKAIATRFGASRSVSNIITR